MLGGVDVGGRCLCVRPCALFFRGSGGILLCGAVSRGFALVRISNSLDRVMGGLGRRGYVRVLPDRLRGGSVGQFMRRLHTNFGNSVLSNSTGRITPTIFRPVVGGRQSFRHLGGIGTFRVSKRVVGCLRRVCVCLGNVSGGSSFPICRRVPSCCGGGLRVSARHLVC